MLPLIGGVKAYLFFIRPVIRSMKEIGLPLIFLFINNRILPTLAKKAGFQTEIWQLFAFQSRYFHEALELM